MKLQWDLGMLGSGLADGAGWMVHRWGEQRSYAGAKGGGVASSPARPRGGAATGLGPYPEPLCRQHGSRGGPPLWTREIVESEPKPFASCVIQWLFHEDFDTFSGEIGDLSVGEIAVGVVESVG